MHGKAFTFEVEEFERRKNACIMRGGLNIACPHAEIHRRVELQVCTRTREHRCETIIEGLGL